MSAAIHARERRLIDRHFAGRATPGGEVSLRAHLADCEACRAYYDRHVLLAGLDPRAPESRERLAAGLGFAPARPSRVLWPVMGVALAAAAVLLVARPAAHDEFQPRGSGSAASTLEVYRASGGTARPAGPRIAADDELAFAYRNPRGHVRLLVVAIDEGGHAYWYHPDPDVTDTPLVIERHPELRELPEAIRHHYQGRSLRILGLFGDSALSVSGVRRWLDASGCAGLQAHLPGLDCVSVALAVERDR